MSRGLSHMSANCLLVLLLWTWSTALAPAAAQAQGSGSASGLQTVDNPGGGQLVYGPLVGASSLQTGMVMMLREVHGHFGDRPNVGKFFQAKGSDSVATFFSLNARQQTGTRPISGLIIVSMPQGAKPAAAVMYDDAARFPRTQPALMKQLEHAWSASARKPPAHASAQATPSGTGQLRMATAGDRSAAIGLAPGWQLKNVYGGWLTAEGPRGELISLGNMYQQIHDPRRRAPMYPPAGGGSPLVYPMGGDLFPAFVSLTNQVRRNRRLPEISYKLLGQRNVPGNTNGPAAIEAHFEVDLKDGKGLRRGSARIGGLYTPGAGTWAMTVDGSSAPVAVADAQASTMLAMIRSYSQDASVIARETQQVIDNIHATANAARARADAQSAANDAQHRAFDQHMDDIDRYSKSFQNYQFDRTQLQDNTYNARGTVDALDADALIRANPGRFQAVPTQDYIKGVDY